MAQPDSFDVIVIGAGIEGSATAYNLSKLKKRVLLLEQVRNLNMFVMVSAQKVSAQKVPGHKVSKSDMMCHKVSSEKYVMPKLHLLMNEIYLLISK